MRDYFLCILIGVIFVSFIIYNEGVTSYDSQIGQYEVLEKKIEALKKENLLLKEDLYRLSSLTYIASRAANMGFVPANIIFIR